MDNSDVAPVYRVVLSGGRSFHRRPRVGVALMQRGRSLWRQDDCAGYALGYVYESRLEGIHRSRNRDDTSRVGCVEYLCPSFRSWNHSGGVSFAELSREEGEFFFF